MTTLNVFTNQLPLAIMTLEIIRPSY
uniref:Uncharacterized protein n=1 Tax=Anguilla anguilla TaxID=7936 RepID=A0A0E9R6R1_ANGAN